MSGLVVDVFVVYLIRVLVRKWRQRGTSVWEPKKTRIASISRRLMAWGCPIVELVYVYKVDDKTFSGMESIPFLWGSSAEDYVRRNPPESSLTIRVKPGEPEISIMRDEDQDRTQASDEHHALHGVC